MIDEERAAELAKEVRDIRRHGGQNLGRLLYLTDELWKAVLGVPGDRLSEAGQRRDAQLAAREQARLAFNHANPPEFGEESEQAARDRLQTARTHALVALALAATA